MICASCGAENAANARYCIRCGAEQPRVAARPSRVRAIAVVASCVVVALAGYGGWKLMTGSRVGTDRPPSRSDVVQIPAGSAPPPTDQSAAPLPAPAALPVDAGVDVATGAAGRAAKSGVTDSTTAQAGAAQPVADSSEPAANAGAKPLPPATKGTARIATQTHTARPRSAAPAHPTGAGAGASVPVGEPAEHVAAAAAPASPPDDHWARMNGDLSRCTREDFINRVICDQRVRIRYCDGYWGKVAQCPVSPSTADVR